MRSIAVGAALLALGAAPAQAERARLGVVIIVDQLSMAQLDRAEDLLGNDGFRRLFGEGALARDARYQGAPSITAHGHATLSTGAYAAHHGIVGNAWWERDKGLVHVGFDPAYKLLTRETRPSDGTAPTQLRAPTFADALRWTHPSAKVVTLSLKDRGAILFGGAKPTATVWFDHLSDRWTTSSYYGDALPAWVPQGSVSGDAQAWERWNDRRLCDLLPIANRPKKQTDCAAVLYEKRVGPDDDPAEQGEAGFGPTFPHVLPQAGEARRGRAFMSTPLADEALLQLAERALAAEQLGQDDVPDLLEVSLSAFDLVGHDFGPESQESLDALLRVDAALGRFLRALDARVGRGRYVVGLTADHGVKPTAEKMRRERQSAGRLDVKAMIDRAESALDAALGPRDYLSPLSNVGFSFKDGALAGLDRARADAIVLDVVRRTEGVAEVFPRSLFVSWVQLRGDAGLFARSYFDGRSPDFIVLPRPLWIFGDVASHGTPYLADMRVPFVIWRAGRGPLALEGIVDPASLTPTLAQILGSAPPAAAEAPILGAVAEHLR